MKKAKQLIGVFLSLILLLSCFSITAFADTRSDQVAFYVIDASTGEEIPITDSQMRAADSVTVTEYNPWEPYQSYTGSYSGTFYSLRSILISAGIDVTNAHGILTKDSNSSYYCYEKSDISYVYVFDQSEVENYGYTVGQKGTYGTGYRGGGSKDDWITNISSLTVAFECSQTYPGSSTCQHKCIYCGKEEHSRLTVPGLFGWKMYDCQYKLNSWVNAEGHWVYVGSDGYVCKGWLQLGKTWYYLDPDDGVMVTGYQIIDGVPYCFADSGAMGVGWVKTKAQYSGYDWYYASSSGRLMSGWLASGGKWYYLDPADYKMRVRWLHSYKGNEYFFKPSGEMATGWTWIPDWDGASTGNWYYFSSSGAMVTGWIYSGGYWYFLAPGGRMAANEWFDGYWLNANGTWTYPYRGSWHVNSYGWWFGDTSGWYARNQKVRIDNSYYYFDGNGYWYY